MKYRKKIDSALICTVNDETQAALQAPEASQDLPGVAALADVTEGIRQGLEDVKNGRVFPARESLETLRPKRAIPL